MLILIRGAGDLASGIALRLHHAHMKIVMTDLPRPSAIRRTVCFSQAILFGSMRVEDVTARRAESPEDALRITAAGDIAVLADPQAACIAALKPDAVVDAILAKRNLGTRITDAPCVIGVGPGFTAGKDCHAAVSSIEPACSICGSENIDRKKDSKWLINIRDDAEFSRILEPAYYYFVLFEPIESHSDVQVSIWQADPKTKGFAYMLMDYYLNIRPASESHAALDLWPYHIKFCLTQPTLIYRSTITAAGEIKISVFPTRGNTRFRVNKN